MDSYTFMKNTSGEVCRQTSVRHCSYVRRHPAHCIFAVSGVLFCYNSLMTPLDPLLLAPAAFLAGVLMFLAPCTLPIVPGYLAFISGSGAFGNEQYKRRGRM